MMGKRRKVDMDGSVVTDAGEGVGPDSPPAPDTHTDPPGADLSGVLDWTVADLLEHVGISTEKVSAELAAFAARHPNAAIPAGLLANILANHFTRGAIEQAIQTVGLGLWESVQAGHGETGHAGAELA